MNSNNNINNSINSNINNNINNNITTQKNPIISQNINILYNNFNNYPSNINKLEMNKGELNNMNNMNNINNINNINMQKNQIKLDPSEYIFEKYGKRGWLCECCNNFNFASRMKCNKCGVKIKPIIIKNIQNNLNEQKKKKEKKKLVKKRGDWICPNCSNNNFAFRENCNRCHLPKQRAFLIMQQTQMMKMKDNINISMNNNNNNQMINQQLNNLLKTNLPNNNNNGHIQQQNINNINNDLNSNYSPNIEQLLYLLNTK